MADDLLDALRLLADCKLSVLGDRAAKRIEELAAALKDRCSLLAANADRIANGEKMVALRAASEWDDEHEEIMEFAKKILAAHDAEKDRRIAELEAALREILSFWPPEAHDKYRITEIAVAALRSERKRRETGNG